MHCGCSGVIQIPGHHHFSGPEVGQSHWVHGERLPSFVQLRKINLPQELLKQFYSAIIESVLCTSITVWFSSATKSDLRRLRRVSGLLSESLVQPSPLSKNCTHPEWAKELTKSLWIQHTLPLWTVTVWSTLQTSEHQNDQTQNQFLPSGNQSHEHLTLNMEHTTLLYIAYSLHILIFYFKFAHIRPVHTYLSILYIVFLLFCTLPVCILFFYYLCPVLLLSFCCTVELLSL